ncbi:hypothetical protein D3C83_305690 [compost metagenome]
MAKPIAASSSSAWCTKPPTRGKLRASACDTEVAGVIGYMATTSMPDARIPIASA